MESIHSNSFSDVSDPLTVKDIKGFFFLSGGTKYSPVWRFCFTLWIILVIALAIKSMVIPGRQSVFGVYGAGVNHWWADQSLYVKYPGIDYFRYAPSTVFLFDPFVRLGPIWGPILWGTASVFAVFFACKRMAGRFWPETQHWALGAAMALLGALSGLWNHQSNAVIGCLLVLGTVDIYDNKYLRGAFLLTTAVVLKSTVFPIIALVILAHPFAMFWRILLLGILFAFTPFLTRPPEIVLWQYGEWWRHLQATQDIRWPGYRDFWYIMLSLAEWVRLGDFDPLFWDCSAPFLYKLLQAGTGIGCFILGILWKPLPPGEWYPRTLSLGLAWLMVFGPATELPTYGLIAPMFCWAFIQQSSRVGKTTFKGQPYLLRVALALVLIISWRELTIYLTPIFPPILAAAPLGTLIFAIWLIRDSQWEIHSRNKLLANPGHLIAT